MSYVTFVLDVDCASPIFLLRKKDDSLWIALVKI